jgi:hypothetical protein
VQLDIIAAEGLLLSSPGSFERSHRPLDWQKARIPGMEFSRIFNGR